MRVPTTRFSTLGTSVSGLPDGTGKLTALLHPPFRCTRAIPVNAAAATLATICVSLHVTTCPAALPSHTTPLPCEAPNPLPVIVTDVPGPPDAGLTLVSYI